jgi:hypothetical protein
LINTYADIALELIRGSAVLLDSDLVAVHASSALEFGFKGYLGISVGINSALLEGAADLLKESC